MVARAAYALVWMNHWLSSATAHGRHAKRDGQDDTACELFDSTHALPGKASWAVILAPEVINAALQWDASHAASSTPNQ